MIKTGLYIKLLNYDFESLFKSKGYAWFTKGYYNLNIIGIRKKVAGNKVTNVYDDYLIVDYDTQNGHCRNIYSITTDPGLYYMKNPMNTGGTAILVPNQYRSAWQIGLHRGKYKALVQAKPVSVYRDNNKNDIYDLNPETTTTGLYGINIHRSNENYANSIVDKYSAGCQVFNSPSEFNSFMRLCEKQRENFSNSFTYTLLDEDELK